MKPGSCHLDSPFDILLPFYIRKINVILIHFIIEDRHEIDAVSIIRCPRQVSPLQGSDP
jgi:hypothetical protein